MEARVYAEPANASVDVYLVQRCMEGDQEAWKLLVSRYERLIYSIALRLCRDHEAAADVRQQVFLQLYQQLDEIKNVSSLPAWIATVARRRAYDHLRSIRPTEPLIDDAHEHLSDVFNRIQFRHTVETALARLPDRSRGLIEMLYISQDQPTYEEVAAKLGMPVSSIGPTRIRTLKKLRQLLT